ncbi:MAG: phosphoribosyltransferase family protein [Oscillospiraceae bacterium]
MKEYWRIHLMLTYEMDIAGLKRELPLCRLADDVYIGAFVIFGDVELTVHCAAEMLKIAPEYDYIIAPEAKSIPLLYEMARQSGENKYFLARKSPKLYMTGVFEVEVKSTTTEKTQRIVLDTADAEQMRGKRILIIDDVISTGESLKAVEDLVLKAGGIVAGRVFVLAEGDAQKRDDILYLAPLPLFDKNGNPKA